MAELDDILRQIDALVATEREPAVDSPEGRATLRRRREALARPVESDTTGPAWASTRDYLVFKAGGAAYAIPVEAVQAIVQPLVATFPGVPAWLVGAFNYRGAVYPLLDGDVLLGNRTAGLRDRTTAVLLSAGGRTVGILIDEAVATMSLHAGDAERAAGEGGGAITAEGVSIVDLGKLLEGLPLGSIEGHT